MQTLVERARQALGVGPDAFLPSTLEAQEQTLKELDVFAPNLKDMVKATRTFADDTNKFLESTAKHSTEAPFPRPWMQGSASEPAQVTQLPVPTEHAAWFDQGVAEREAGVVPGAVGYAFSRELLAPMEQWLWAHQVAQGYLSDLQSKRLTYDSERRQLVQRATDAVAEAPHPTGGTLDPALAQLTEEAATISMSLHDFESDVEALDDLLAWLAEGAVRLKALLADTAGGVRAAAESWVIPPGIMPPFPDKSNFGENLEVTVEVADAPLGLSKKEEVVAGRISSSEAGGVTTITSLNPHTKSHSEASCTAGDTAPMPQPDLGEVLPSDDAMVYGGGVAPPEPDAPPSGGGVTQLLKDTLAAPPRTSPSQDQVRRYEHNTTEHAVAQQGGIVGFIKDTLSRPPRTAASAGQDRDQDKGHHEGQGTEKQGLSKAAAGHDRDQDRGREGAKEQGVTAGQGYRPDLSEVLPSDEALVYGGGMAPPADITEPSGGDVGQLIKESATGKVTPVGDEQAEQAKQKEEGKQQSTTGTLVNPDLSAVLPDSDAMVYGGGVAPTSATGTAKPPGGGVGQLVKDTLLPSSDTPAVPSATPAVPSDTPAVPSATPAVPSDTPAVPSASAAVPSYTPALPSDTAPWQDSIGSAPDSAEQHTTQQDTDAGSTDPQPGSIWAAIQRTVAEAASAVAHAVPGTGHGGYDDDSYAFGSHAIEDEEEAVQDEENEGAAESQPPAATDSKVPLSSDDYVVATQVTGADSEDAGLTPPVGLTEPAAAAPAPGQPEMPPTMPTAAYPPTAGPAPTAENIRVTAQRVRGSLAVHSEATGGSSRTGAQVPLHQGAVDWRDVVVGDPTAMESAEPGSMHIGPVTPPEGPAEPAPGGAEWVKAGEQPGGAAAGGVAVKDTAAVKESEQGKMHIGPVTPPEGPAEAAPGSCEWVKQGTRPGGAAAAAPAGSADDDVEQDKDSSSGKEGPDLSKILPSYEGGIAVPHTKPEGGGIGTFLKDTLLGPAKQGK